MNRETLANIVFWFHVVWILILLSGFFIPESLQPYHTVAASTTIAAQVIWGGCPLVTLENRLRNGSFDGSFTAYLFRKLFGVDIKPWFVSASLIVIFFTSCFLTLT